jgi:hypothetical protein
MASGSAATAAPPPPLPPPPPPAAATTDTVAEVGKHLRTMEQRQRTHTEAAVAAAAEKTAGGLRRLLLLVAAPAVLLLALLAGGVAFVALRGPGGDTHVTHNNVDNSITVHLHGVPYLDDHTVVYLLDGSTVPRQTFQKAIQLTVGEHELVIKRGDEVVESRRFYVGRQDEDGELALPVAEPEGKPGELTRVKAPTVSLNLVAPCRVAFSADGRYVVAAGYDGRSPEGWVMRLDVTAEKASAEFVPMQSVRDLAVNPRGNGEAVFAVSGGTLQFWDVRRWRDLRQVTVKDALTPRVVQYSPDGKRLLSSWTYGEGEAKWHTAVVESADAGGKEVARLEVGPAAFGPDGEHVLHPTDGGKTLAVVALKDRKVVSQYEGHSAPISAIACSPDGKYVAAGTSGPTIAVRVWEVETGREVAGPLFGHSRMIRSIAFSPDNRRLLSGGGNEARLWDLSTGKALETYGFDHDVVGVCFSPAGGRGAGASLDGTVRVWRLPPR